ncbi:DUF6907 domain-containing protein [Nocardia sp. NPDC052566]|uniref:DUF6907 domain-containing protein n=1 Tax=Nocardia sp. NPDC052566 TaxID=3364330 RepID=UPI0037CB9C1D
MTVVLACPSWCDVHVNPDPTEPEHGGSHYGVAQRVPLSREVTRRPPEPVMFVQLFGYDHAGSRDSMIDLVLPTKLHVELTAAQARAVAEAVIAAADVCGAAPGAVSEKFGVDIHDPFDFPVQVQPVGPAGADDIAYVELLLRHRYSAELTEAEARICAANLLNSAELLDAVE